MRARPKPRFGKEENEVSDSSAGSSRERAIFSCKTFLLFVGIPDKA